MEMASQHIRLAIDGLLHAYALASMHRATDKNEHRQAALQWFDAIEKQISCAKEDLERDAK